MSTRKYLRRCLRWAGYLVVTALGGATTSHAAPAQRSHAYWETQPDSLRQLLTGPLADTTRLRMLEHLADVEIKPATLRQVVALAAKLHRPEYRAYRAWLACEQLPGVWSGQHPLATRVGLDSMRVVVTQFAALGRQAAVPLLVVGELYLKLHQQEARRAFYQAQLGANQERSSLENVAACTHGLASYYWYRGDYNQALTYYFRAADYARTFSWGRYYNELGVIGDVYAEWGNDARAQDYLLQALRAKNPATLTYTYRSLARLYLRQGRYVAAQQAIAGALRAAHQLPGKNPVYDKAYALVLRAAVLVAQHRPAAGPLLARVQQLADSLHLPVNSPQGDFELDATWARYYESRGEQTHAAAAWQRALTQAQQVRSTPLRLAYLRQLARFYRARGQAAPAATYYALAAALADSIDTSQRPLRVAQYEVERPARQQAARLAHLRQQQVQAAAQARQQRTLLWSLLAGVSLLAALAVVQRRSQRRQRQANAQLSVQQGQLEAQAIRLTQLDAAKNQFFANVSHELRTPLMLVLGPLGQALAQVRSPAARELLATSDRHGQQLRTLIDRILDLTKLEAGKLTTQPSPTRLAALLRELVAEFTSLAQTNGVALCGPPGLADDLVVALDAEKLGQVLRNLLANALTHTPPGGQVEVTLRQLKGEAYALTVHDTGPGIAADEQARVFERFYQSPQRPVRGGTGLGLALSRELAALLGGTLTLVSEPGQGAAFTLTFVAPRLRASAGPPARSQGSAQTAQLGEQPAPGASSQLAGPGAPQASPSAPSPVRRPTILLVEDHAELRAYLSYLLASDYRVLEAADGQQALTMLASTAVDLVASDAMMPQLSGLELLQQLRADPTYQGLPFLMLTARADEAHRLAALATGVDDYLIKPFTDQELLTRVRPLLARRLVRQHFANYSPQLATLSETEPRTPELLGWMAAEAVDPPVPQLLPPEQLRHWQVVVMDYLVDPAFGPAELAAVLCLSERTLYRRLGELAGLTPAAWLRELRLTHARQLLETGSFGSVAEVAIAAGFANVKSFSQRYAERFGRRPSEYRS